jgi:2-polyprenyl-3-methyl-5-hydroxy-6-metoxy-1,4-benzoquinol methylase
MENSQTRPTPSLNEQEQWWNRWNLEYRSGGFGEVGLESAERGKKVLQLCQSLIQRRAEILEVGCGTGWLSEKLLAFGDVTAVDLSQRAIAAAKERIPTARFIAGDFYQLALPVNSFDMGICLETIAYVPDQQAFIIKLASLIRPGGFVILTSVNKFVYERRNDVGPPGPGQIRKWLSRSELKRLMKPHFKLVQFTTVLPTGNGGILRLVNSHKVNALLNHLISPETVRRIKEKLGFGQTHVVVAQKR